jgi:hypothetical protein
MVDTDEPTPLALFLDMHDYAIEQTRSAKRQDKAYWQGVKDGLRKAYSLFTDEKYWARICDSSMAMRPENAWNEDDPRQERESAGH